MKGFIVYPTYDLIEEETVVKLFGRLENGQSFVTINKIVPYFFVKEDVLKRIDKYLSKSQKPSDFWETENKRLDQKKVCCSGYKVEKTDFANFKGEKVAKIFHPNYQELNKLHHALHQQGIETYESDIKPHTRFLIDKNILSSLNIEGEYISSEKVDRVYQEPELKPAENLKHKLKVISLDIETSRSKENLICIGLHGENYSKVFFVTDKKIENVVPCKDEYECLQKFKAELLKLDPDIITGWNVIDFDLAYLAELFAKHKIPFDIGRTNEKPRLRIEAHFMRSSSADISGRQVLDALNLVSDPFIQQAPTMRFAQFESYSLEDVSQAILGKGKLIKKHSMRKNKIDKLYEENTIKSHKEIADYNLNDAKLVYEILEKTDTIALAIERSELTGMPLDRITASIAAFDSLYIREAKKRNIVSPSTKYGMKEERLKGGYVFSSGAGIYNNVIVLDFKSLYPSILRTFNIDPASHLEKKEKGAIESPNHEYFKNGEGILPEIIKKLHHARENAKKQKKELANYAIKMIMLSFWGVLASPNCRYFNLGMGNAITAFARWIIQTTSQLIEKLGYKVIYIDTDSIFIETALEKEKANALGKEIENYINKYYDDYLKKTYSRVSYLELQFDKQYLSFMIPELRKKGEEGAPTAAKKRYAGLVEKNGKEELEITGLEAIRGDWTEAAREFQKELLMRLFKKEPIGTFIKSYINKIKSGKLDNQLVYRKSLRKPLEEYTKTTPPHVKAARQLDKIESNIIEYYVTTEGPEPLQKLRHKIDYEHYIEKQIKPIANQVLSLLKNNFDEMLKSSKQAKLFG